jgi:(2R)-phospho-3-sulfolactate synthase (ComA)
LTSTGHRCNYVGRDRRHKGDVRDTAGTGDPAATVTGVARPLLPVGKHQHRPPLLGQPEEPGLARRGGTGLAATMQHDQQRYLLGRRLLDRRRHPRGVAAGSRVAAAQSAQHGAHRKAPLFTPSCQETRAFQQIRIFRLDPADQGGRRTVVIDTLEAPNKDLQTYFLRRMGPWVNVGNVRADDVIAIERLRRGLRSDTLRAAL